MKVKAFVLGALGYALIACSSTSKLPCATTDWYELGRRHGAAGAPESAIEKVEFHCATEEEKQDAIALYESGRGLGLAEYCTESNGFELGRIGQPYLNVCPLVLEEAFLRGYHRGRKVAETREADRRISQSLQEIENQLRQPGLSFARRGLLEGQKIQLEEERKNLSKMSSAESSVRR